MIFSKNIYLIGAGFTKAVYPQAPLNKNLLEAAISSGAKKLSFYQKKYRTDDIERLLTIADLDGLTDEQIRKDRKEIESELSTFFSNYRFSALNSNIPSWLATFSVDILKEKDSVVSLNYDCSLEGVLDFLGVWTPRGGYARISALNINSILPNPKNIIIHKIHGSENFVESFTVGKNTKQTAIGFNINKSIYPKSGANLQIGGGSNKPRHYIIAPSFVKAPHVDIAAMMLDLLDVASKATCFSIIGCGMRPEDSFLWLLLTRFLNVSQNNRKKLVILGPSSNDIWDRISSFWVGDISSFTNVSIIPCVLEDGISSLKSAVEA